MPQKFCATGLVPYKSVQFMIRTFHQLLLSVQQCFLGEAAVHDVLPRALPSVRLDGLTARALTTPLVLLLQGARNTEPPWLLHPSGRPNVVHACSRLVRLCWCSDLDMERSYGT
jgi:hypothetical protein